MAYNFSSTEKKWQRYWEKNQKATEISLSKKKYYALSMFPYPSGSGLHVGHWRGYVLTDIYARLKSLQGYNVLQPMGWDAFGLPAENDAIKKNIKPQESTARNIATFKEQLHEMGASYDWSKEINTTHPDYYKWTQWIFLQMYKAGLAYQTQIKVNWCPSCLTGLANEEVVKGGCERCGTPVTLKDVWQWILRITHYAERLIDGLEELDWPENIKTMQKNWIGKSQGLVFDLTIKDLEIAIQTFSAHFEAFIADSFVAIAPDHPLLVRLLEGIPQKDTILAYATRIVNERKHTVQQEPTGIFTHRYAIDKATGKELAIWVASYVLADYGTGMVKCSAHDERDFAFAKKYNIPMHAVLFPQDPQQAERVKNLEICYSDMNAGILDAPALFKGRKAKDARQDIMDYCIQQGYAQLKTAYKLRDWVFSRQRYWGEPIPLIHCECCGIVCVPETELPVLLPDVEHYQPTGTGQSPLADIKDWVTTTCPSCKGVAQRETNTMPQWAGSCWYFLRYPNAHLSTQAFSTDQMNYWLPVDLYVGGIEHAILHLLYARFYVKVLHDLGYLSFDEPFFKLFNQGMITKYSEKTGHTEKMSKSKGNVVNPDDMVKQYGADALRMYIMFIGPPELDAVWQDNGIEGMKRFLQRLWDYLNDPITILENGQEQIGVTKRFNLFLRQYQERLTYFRPNTAIACAMEWLNDAIKYEQRLTKDTLQKLLVSLSVIIPYMSSELLETLCGVSLSECSWPVYDEALIHEDSYELIIQVNGKMRGSLHVAKNVLHDQLEQQARIQVQKWLEGASIKNIIFIPERLINFVIA